jgi:hypothetical protein
LTILPIAFLFLWSRFSRRNNANDLDPFFLSFRVSYQQKQGIIDHSQGSPPILAALDAILFQYGERVQENAGCRAETDVMLTKIAFSLGIVPLKSHRPLRPTNM